MPTSVGPVIPRARTQLRSCAGKRYLRGSVRKGSNIPREHLRIDYRSCLSLKKSAFITRKGAISARRDELGIIPGSMGAKSFIVRGLGNADSFCSCSHGAGRRMSRTEAKRRFNRRDLEEQTAGVECRKDGGVLDEIPGAYKDIDEVMTNQSDLVEVVHTLKQIVCIKG